jgi:hypothetical protein
MLILIWVTNYIRRQHVRVCTVHDWVRMYANPQSHDSCIALRLRSSK